MAGTLGAGGRRQQIVAINMTPFVDIALVLLVIMMVSALYIVSQALKVELPKTSNSDGSQPSIATVTITKDRKLYFNGEAVDENELVGELRRAREKSKDVSMVVTADGEAYHGAVVHIIDVAKTEGITKFAINVERSN
jgi:biopolymer transport protein ExbD